MNIPNLPNVPEMLPFFHNQQNKIRRKMVVVENCIHAVQNDTLLKAVYGENSELLYNLKEACEDFMYACQDEIDYLKTYEQHNDITLQTKVAGETLEYWLQYSDNDVSVLSPAYKMHHKKDIFPSEPTDKVKRRIDNIIEKYRTNDGETEDDDEIVLNLKKLQHV